MQDWVKQLLEVGQQFILTPQDRLEYEAQLARARAEETRAQAELVRATTGAGQMNMLIPILFVGVLAAGAIILTRKA